MLTGFSLRLYWRHQMPMSTVTTSQLWGSFPADVRWT